MSKIMWVLYQSIYALPFYLIIINGHHLCWNTETNQKASKSNCKQALQPAVCLLKKPSAPANPSPPLSPSASQFSNDPSNHSLCDYKSASSQPANMLQIQLITQANSAPIPMCERDRVSVSYTAVYELCDWHTTDHHHQPLNPRCSIGTLPILFPTDWIQGAQ